MISVFTKRVDKFLCDMFSKMTENFVKRYRPSMSTKWKLTCSKMAYFRRIISHKYRYFKKKKMQSMFYSQVFVRARQWISSEISYNCLIDTLFQRGDCQTCLELKNEYFSKKVSFCCSLNLLQTLCLLYKKCLRRRRKRLCHRRWIMLSK